MLRRTPGSPYSNAEVGAARTKLIWHYCQFLDCPAAVAAAALQLLHSNPIVGQTDGLAATEDSVPSEQCQLAGREVSTVPRRWLMLLLRRLLLLLLLRLYLVSS